MRQLDPAVKECDPRGLIYEAYRIDGITAADCRAIYFDWALGLDAARDTKADTAALLAHYGVGADDHPMTTVLRDGLGTAAAPRRRGGREGRVGSEAG